MSEEYACPPKLKLIIDHLKAVCAIDEYVNGIALEKDIQDLCNFLQRDLTRRVLRPAGWEELYRAEGALYSSPESKWQVVKDDRISIEIYIQRPVPKVECCTVNLFVPPHWKKRQEFIAKLKAPPGFEHVSQYAPDELSDSYSVFRTIRYESYLTSGDLFDSTAFINAFRKATKALVSRESVIDAILKRLI
jgi:hypothetical protein